MGTTLATWYALLLLAAATVSTPAPTTPAIPQTAEASATQTVPSQAPVYGLAETLSQNLPTTPQAGDKPVRVMIPSIGVDSAIQNMGINKKGELDVPSGKTKNVGWYAKGTVPGFTGSAVFDAHVYAAFAKLKYAKVGSDIYVVTASGKTLHFTVQDSRVYKLGELTSNMLFNQNDAKRLNLITCAGTPTADGSTYTHRLVVYATLVEDQGPVAVR